MRKLVNTIRKWCKVNLIYVGSVLPRADREVELEADVRLINKGMTQAVKDLKRHDGAEDQVMFIPLHRLFLEQYKYRDLSTGKMAQMLMIVKPLERFFIWGTPRLNDLGKHHLKSYMLQYLQILSGINSWEGIPTVCESSVMQDMKLKAWVEARNSGHGEPV